MINVAALTSGRNVPSARFRIRQHISGLLVNGIIANELFSSVEKYSPVPKSLKNIFFGNPEVTQKAFLFFRQQQKRRLVSVANKNDIVWLERCLIERKLTHEPRIRKPIVLDVDDAIWLGEAKGFADILVKQSRMVIAGNSYLSDWCKQYNGNVRVIPTAVNTSAFKPISKIKLSNTFIIGWIGTSSNFKFLKTIVPAISILLKENLNVQFFICSNLDPKFYEVNYTFVQWNQENEAAFINSIDIGLMPLWDDEWSRGKCSFKMLQYLSCGIPAVVSPVGMNKQVADEWGYNFLPQTNEEWIEIIRNLILDENLRKESGENGRLLIEKKYSTSVVCSQLTSVFKEVYYSCVE